METGRIGRRIAYWRDRRGFTQSDFGRLMGQTKRWVQDIEGGQRQQDPRLSVLLRAADVLRVPLEQLLTDSTPAPLPASEPPAEALAVIDVLYSTDEPSGAPLPLGTLRRRLAYCCDAFQACHYGALGRDLPPLILQAQRNAAHAGPDASEAHAVLSRVLQLSASFLHKYGSVTAVQAAVIADRSLTAAERSGDPIAIGAASRRVAKSLTYQARPEQAVAFATDAARRLHDDLVASGSLGLSTLGMLYLNAAIAASTDERSTAAVQRATAHVDEAGEIAEQQGADLNEDYTAFGPTNVGLHRVDVLARFEDGWSALEAADELTAEAIGRMTKERTAQHLITMARAQLLARKKDKAAESLVQAAQLAPEEVKGRQSTVGLVKDILGATPVPSAALAPTRHPMWTHSMSTLYLIACAAGPTQHVDEGVRQAQARGWDVCLILTPSAARWWEPRIGELEAQTGHPVRSQYKLPWQSDALPKADAMLVAPLSATSLNKWGAGIADTLALGLVTEGVHMAVPVIAMPYFNRAQGAQPAVARSIADLRAQGVRYLDGVSGYESHLPKHGAPSAYPWARALDAIGAA